MKSLRSSTAIRKPARTLVRGIPAVAPVLPPAVAGSPRVGGARQVRMPLASATEVALFRLTRILLLVAVAFCLGAPAAGAVPAKKLDNNLAALWRTVLQTPSAQNPFGEGGLAFACLNLGGTVAPFTPVPTGVPECKVKPGTKIFVPVAVECSTLEEPPFFGADEKELRACAQRQLALEVSGVPPIVTVDGKTVPVTMVETPLLNFVLPAGNIFVKPEGTTGLSVGAGWVALLHPLTPGTHTIKIHTAKPSDIETRIVVQPGLKP